MHRTQVPICPFGYTEREDTPADDLMRNRQPRSSCLTHTCRGEIRRRRRPVCVRHAYKLTLAVLGFRRRGSWPPRRRVLSEQSERTGRSRRAFIGLLGGQGDVTARRAGQDAASHVPMYVPIVYARQERRARTCPLRLWARPEGLMYRCCATRATARAIRASGIGIRRWTKEAEQGGAPS